MSEIPKVKIAILGGSTMIGANFPRAYSGVKVIADNLVFEIPFGKTASFTRARTHKHREPRDSTITLTKTCQIKIKCIYF